MYKTPEKLIEQSCCSCSAQIWLSEVQFNRLKDNGNIFYCINGHSQSYPASRVGTLEKELSEKNSALQVAEHLIAKLERKLKRKLKRKK